MICETSDSYTSCPPIKEYHGFISVGLPLWGYKWKLEDRKSCLDRQVVGEEVLVLDPQITSVEVQTRGLQDRKVVTSRVLTGLRKLIVHSRGTRPGSLESEVEILVWCSFYAEDF